jgi:hypothetical protein
MGPALHGINASGEPFLAALFGDAAQSHFELGARPGDRLHLLFNRSTLSVALDRRGRRTVEALLPVMQTPIC